MTKPFSAKPKTTARRDDLDRLEQIPNVGPATAEDFRLLGLHHPADLKNQNAYDLYDKLCRKVGTRIDPCVIDVFLAAVDYMNGGPSTPWWKFTPARKRHLSGQA
jgi:hypothetical protein